MSEGDIALLREMIEYLGDIHDGGSLVDSHYCRGCDGQPVTDRDWNSPIIHQMGCKWIKAMKLLGVDPKVEVEDLTEFDHLLTTEG